MSEIVKLNIGGKKFLSRKSSVNLIGGMARRFLVLGGVTANPIYEKFTEKIDIFGEKDTVEKSIKQWVEYLIELGNPLEENSNEANLLEYKGGEGHLPKNMVNAFQSMGGFSPEFKDDTSDDMKKEILERLDITDILKRLNSIAQNNLISCSELNLSYEQDGDDKIILYKKGKDVSRAAKYKRKNILDKNLNYLGFNQVFNHEDFKDSPTGFVTSNQSCKLVYNQNPRIHVVRYDSKLFASIHLDGDGPKNRSIDEFIKSSLQFGDEIPDVISGDTNITVNKVNWKQENWEEEDPNSSRDEIGHRIKKALNNYVKKEGADEKWIVIMSNFKIAKFRQGLFLRNQQLKKSIGKKLRKGKEEEDGTILAFKTPLYNNEEYVKSLLTYNKCSTIYYGDGDNMVTNKVGVLIKYALHFEKDFDENNPENNIGEIFIDHSVLKINLSEISRETFNGETFNEETSNEETSEEKLYVLNMGSIINTINKDWNIDINKFSLDIIESEKKIFKILKENNETIDFEYDEITGSSNSINGNKGYEKVNIQLDNENIYNICKEIHDLYVKVYTGTKE